MSFWNKTYRKVSNISRTLVGNEIVNHSDVVGAAGFNGLGKDNCKARREILMFDHWMRLILDNWRYYLVKYFLILYTSMRLVFSNFDYDEINVCQCSAWAVGFLSENSLIIYICFICYIIIQYQVTIKKFYFQMICEWICVCSCHQHARFSLWVRGVTRIELSLYEAILGRVVDSYVEANEHT